MAKKEVQTDKSLIRTSSLFIENLCAKNTEPKNTANMFTGVTVSVFPTGKNKLQGSEMNWTAGRTETETSALILFSLTQFDAKFNNNKSARLALNCSYRTNMKTMHLN